MSTSSAKPSIGLRQLGWNLHTIAGCELRRWTRLWPWLYHRLNRPPVGFVQPPVRGESLKPHAGVRWSRPVFPIPVLAPPPEPVNLVGFAPHRFVSDGLGDPRGGAVGIFQGARVVVCRQSSFVVDAAGRIARKRTAFRRNFLPKMPLLRWRRPQRMPRRAVALVGESHFHYFHWLFDALAALRLIDRAGLLTPGLPVLVPPLTQPFHRATLAALPILAGHPVIELRPDESVEVDEVIHGYLTSGPHGVAAWAIDFFRDQFADLFERAPGRPTRLYLSRRTVTARQLENGAEVEEQLRRREFVSVAPDTLPWPEQMSLFAGARVMIGVHGTAFTNAIASPQGAVLGEIFAPDYFDLAFHHLARARRLHYGAFQAEIGGQRGPQGGSLRVDVDALMRWVDRLTAAGG